MGTQSHAYIATHDELTGLPNRRCIDDLARALGLDAKSDLVVVLIALDGIEAVDDDTSSVKRDDVLKTLAHGVRGCARSDDVVARLSPSELVLMLTPRIGGDEEARLLERLRRAIAEPLSHLQNVSARVGVARCPEDGTALEALLAAAERRMRTKNQPNPAR
jgi:diguanylate cyclase (GGDEF)-like protein